MEETVRRVKPRQQAVFEGGGSLEFFQVPDFRRKLRLGIFLNPSAYMEGQRLEYF